MSDLFIFTLSCDGNYIDYDIYFKYEDKFGVVNSYFIYEYSAVNTD